MRRAHHGTLSFGPPQRIQTERWPVLFRITTGINLLFQAEQAQMPRLMRAESGHLDIVMKQVWILRNFVVAAGKELFLIIEAWPPGQVAAYLQVFAQTMPDHVGRMHAFA